ncbi:MAG: hypothetical protein U9R66_14095 [Thermodesulfobacteriota bacterium]|nr:hypothetical protein [Thermodesulfobacteriota bacterium]
MNRNLPFFPNFILLAVLLLLTSCAAVEPEQEQVAISSIKTITIFPVQTVEVAHHFNDDIKNQLEAGVYTMTSLLTQYFAGIQSEISFQFISNKQMESLLGKHQGNLFSQARFVSSQMNSDAVLLITLERFRERDGTQYSVEAPASVSFEYKLLKSDGPQILCNGVFEETQVPLTDNIFTLKKAKKRGFKWITAEDLAREGIKEKFGACPYLK